MHPPPKRCIAIKMMKSIIKTQFSLIHSIALFSFAENGIIDEGKESACNKTIDKHPESAYQGT
jgi:hypothetical protein